MIKNGYKHIDPPIEEDGVKCEKRKRGRKKRREVKMEKERERRKGIMREEMKRETKKYINFPETLGEREVDAHLISSPQALRLFLELIKPLGMPFYRDLITFNYQKRKDNLLPYSNIVQFTIS